MAASCLTLGVWKCLLGDQKKEKIRITNKWGKPQKLKTKIKNYDIPFDYPINSLYFILYNDFIFPDQNI